MTSQTPFGFATTTVEKQHSSETWKRLRERFYAAGDASNVFEERTRLVDTLVARSYRENLAMAFPGKLALLAVGGFGRRELFPFSDVDLLLLVEETPKGAGQEAISVFLRALWDAQLRVSHSVRIREDCCEVHDQNIELNISLLDQRFLAGDQHVYEKLTLSLPRFLHSRRMELARHLCRLSRERHAKFHDTIFHLEPNVKDGPGGLRDYQVIRWLSQLRNSQPGVFAAADAAPELGEAFAFFSSVRCFLHFEAGRDASVLTFECQEKLAEQPFRPARSPSQGMRKFYRDARQIQASALRAIESAEEKGSTLLTQFRSWRGRVSNAEFSVAHERVYLKSPGTLETDPAIIFRLFTFCGRHGLRLAAETERRVIERLSKFREFAAAETSLWPHLKEILTQPHADLALRAMHESGVLVLLIPEWEAVECLSLRDFYHRYTVDEHTLVTIETVCELARTKRPAAERFVNLLSEVEDSEILLMALLLHDVGKASSDSAHAAESARQAAGALRRLGIPEGGRRAIVQLIERHLDLSSAMNSRDLEEQSTAEHLAHRTETIELLKKLTLLTFADISAVNPGAMTSWRMDRLWRCYLVAHQELTRELETERIESAPDLPAEASHFVAGFPTRYLRTHTAEEIGRHAALYAATRDKGVALAIERLEGYFRMTVVTHDRPFLFASIAGAISSFGLNILKAEAFSNRHGTVLDTFVFGDPNRNLELNPSEVDRLSTIVERVILGKENVKLLLSSRPRPTLPSRGARIRPSVAFDSSTSETATLVEIVAQDRPGLLYDLASTFSAANCGIEVVLIDTEAHKALDVFYITNARGQKLNPQQQEALQQQLLSVCQA